MKIENKKNHGFTLIEMILVLAIIAIISTLAIPQVNKYLNQANKTKIISALTELNNTSVMWSIENNGNIPNNLSVVLQEQGDLTKLNIGLTPNGSFVIGNIKGKIINQNEEIFAKIDANSKAYMNEEIHVK